MIIFQKSDDEIHHLIKGFVERSEQLRPQVVRILPETRITIQIFMGDEYWVREQHDNEWHKVPRIGLWAPRYKWAYGFSNGDFRVFGCSINAAMFQTILKTNLKDIINNIIDLEKQNNDFAKIIMPLDGEKFHDWHQRISENIKYFGPSDNSLHREFDIIESQLATNSLINFDEIIKELNISERQFRRLFEKLYGVSIKTYQRAIKADRMIRQLHHAPWESDIFKSYPIEYTDQSHAIREFKHHTGITPRQYSILKLGGDATLRSINANDILPPDIP